MKAFDEILKLIKERRNELTADDCWRLVGRLEGIAVELSKKEYQAKEQSETRNNIEIVSGGKNIKELY